MSLELATPPEHEAEISEMILAQERMERINSLSEANIGDLGSQRLEISKVILGVRQPLHIVSHLVDIDGSSEWLTEIIDGEDFQSMDMGVMPGVMSPVEEKAWRRMLLRKKSRGVNRMLPPNAVH